MLERVLALQLRLPPGTGLVFDISHSTVPAEASACALWNEQLRAQHQNNSDLDKLVLRSAPHVFRPDRYGCDHCRAANEADVTLRLRAGEKVLQVFASRSLVPACVDKLSASAVVAAESLFGWDFSVSGSHADRYTCGSHILSAIPRYQGAAR